MANNVDFDALSRKAIESGGAMADLNNLYGHAMALPEWYFVARGEFPDVKPYIASNAQYADGKHMVRAFTDKERLQRFAKENNLMGADGEVLTLDIPTANIIEYLEQFIAYGVHGIWFNSDNDSDGFFVPLQQLRPIKAHLERINWGNTIISSPSAPAENPAGKNSTVSTLAKLLEENAELIEGYDEENAVLTAIIGGSAEAMDARPPEEKGEVVSNVAEMLDSVRREYNMSPRLFEFFIEFCLEKRKFIIPVLAFALSTREAEKVKRLEQDEQLSQELARWIINKLVPGSDLLNPPVSEQSAQSPVEKFGLSLESPDEDVDINLSFVQQGEVKFDTSIAPFYEAIVPLLENYQGAGEYISLLSLDANAMSELVENIASNAHGAYLRIRRYLYRPANTGASVGFNTIDSNQLRHVQTRASLLVNFALCKNLDNPAAKLYIRFSGHGGEVNKLKTAVMPILEDCGFKALAE